MNKKLIVALTIAAVAAITMLVATIGIAGYYIFAAPTSPRNIAANGFTAYVTVPDDTRQAIVSTYTKQEFTKLSSAQIAKLNDRVDGTIEGDKPYADVKKLKNIGVSFTHNDKPIQVENPEVKIALFPEYQFLPQDGTAPSYTEQIKLKPAGKDYVLEFGNLAQHTNSKNGITIGTLEITYSYQGKDYVSYTCLSLDIRD